MLVALHEAFGFSSNDWLYTSAKVFTNVSGLSASAGYPEPDCVRISAVTHHYNRREKLYHNHPKKKLIKVEMKRNQF